MNDMLPADVATDEADPYSEGLNAPCQSMLGTNIETKVTTKKCLHISSESFAIGPVQFS